MNAVEIEQAIVPAVQAEQPDVNASQEQECEFLPW
ncbi:hypothetical protein BCF46_1249 [Litoreibacter meonggei]|uniref:Uncharacterized protein n=1 Tax=Litoreibacter meonggei TaxID=1049199 RepID=A0A497X100_9RHOB|nr:hypothetical protein BCF46_1249 [Litoreibacter meonggei]